MAATDLKTAGEDAAARYLEGVGLRVIERNVRLRIGELDLVCYDGRTLVFVEVKSRVSDRFAWPEESVGRRKQTKIRHLAEAYLALKRPGFDECRFDVVAVVYGEGGEPVIRHLPDAF